MLIPSRNLNRLAHDSSIIDFGGLLVDVLWKKQARHIFQKRRHSLADLPPRYVPAKSWTVGCDSPFTSTIMESISRISSLLENGMKAPSSRTIQGVEYRR
jgi:hypothetical protein